MSRPPRVDGDATAETVHDPSGEVGHAATITPLPGALRTVEASSDTARPVRRGGDLTPGTMAGEYRIERRIGQGGMGAVYAAIHPVIGKRAAVKVLKAEFGASMESITRFVSEARAVNQIGHPNIVDVFSFGELADGRHYFVMELLEGESLGERMRRGRLPLGACCEVLDEIARGLIAAHAKRIIHRDLKPDNIFLVERAGEPPKVKILDFGIAKLVDEDGQRLEKTRSGALIGTPQYIAPEQARGYAIDERVDVYSLGVMAFEMLTGAPPFQADNAADMIAKHLAEPPPAPRSRAPVPRDLDRLVHAMLAKDPAERPTLERVREVLDETRRRAATPGELLGTVPDAALPAPLRVARTRRRGVLLGGGLVAIAGAATAAVLALGGGAAGTSRAVAPAVAPAVDAAVEVARPVTIDAGAAVVPDAAPVAATTVDAGVTTPPKKDRKKRTPAGRDGVTVPSRGGPGTGSGGTVTQPPPPPPPDDDDGVVDPFARKKP